MGITVLIPAYNEEETIAKVVLKSMKHADKVVVCDDGSEDMTGDIAERLGAEVIRHERNMGYGASLSSLFRRGVEVGSDVVVTLDGDGQHDPDAIPALVDPIAKGEADMVVGSRFLENGGATPGYRSVGIRVITNFSNRASDSSLTDAQSGFRAYSTKVVDRVAPSELGMGASTEILLKAGRANLRVAEVPIVVTYERRASKNPVYHGVEVLFSTVKHLSILHPLLAYGVPGLLFLGVGLLYGSKALAFYTETHRIVISMTLISIGAIMIGMLFGITAIILWIMITLIRDPVYRNASAVSISEPLMRAGVP